MKNYGEVPPVTGNTPAPTVGSVTGLGTGGGAGVFTPNGTGFGFIEIKVGSNPSAGGSLALNFAATPPTLFLSGSEDFGTITQSTLANAVTISWAGTPRKNSRGRIYYEWNSSF